MERADSTNCGFWLQILPLSISRKISWSSTALYIFKISSDFRQATLFPLFLNISQDLRLVPNTIPKRCVKEDVPSWKLKSAVTDSSSWRLLRFAPIWLPPWRKTFLHFAKWWQSDSSWDAVSSSPLFWREIFHFWQKEFDRENASLKNQFDFVFTCFYFDTENVQLWKVQCCQIVLKFDGKKSLPFCNKMFLGFWYLNSFLPT